MKFSIFAAAALALAASASAMIIEPNENLKAREEYGGHGGFTCIFRKQAWISECLLIP